MVEEGGENRDSIVESDAEPVPHSHLDAPSPETRASDSGPDLSKLAALEAVLFMAAEPIGAAELAEIIGVTPAEVEALAAELGVLFEDRGVQLARVAGGYQVSTRPEYGPFVAKLHKPERFRLSRAAFETLAIIAYKQPVTRPEMEAVRGVNADSAVDTLMQYQLIREAGRKDAPGRPMQYQTTESFLGYFGLNSVKDLPPIDSIPADEDAVRAEVQAMEESKGQSPPSAAAESGRGDDEDGSSDDGAPAGATSEREQPA